MPRVRYSGVSTAVLAMLLLRGDSVAQVTIVPDTTSRVSVTGSGSIVVPPDMAEVTLGVYVLDRDLVKAKATSDHIVQALLRLVVSSDIPPQDVSSSALSIEPSYSEAESHEFLGYEVTRSVDLTLRDLEKLDQLIDKAIQAGANRQFRVSLKSSREKELREQALDMAIEDAKAQASRLASGFGAKLGAVRSISPGDPRSGTTMYTAASVSYGRGTFVPGTIRVEVVVSVTYELQR